MRMHAPTRGWTLIELLVTIAVAGVLIGAAVPSYQAMVRRSQMVDAVNDMTMAIAFARSEAARRGGGVALDAAAPGNAANEWGPGWNVVMIADALPRVPLQSFAAVSGGITLNGTDGVTTITFNSRGLPDRAMTVDMCQAGVGGVRLAMSVVGRPSRSDLAAAACP